MVLKKIAEKINYYFRLVKRAPFNSFFLFIKGYMDFQKTGNTSQESYLAMRHLYVITNGKFNDFVHLYYQKFKPLYQEVKPYGVLGELSKTELQNIVQEIKNNGFYISDKKLDSSIIQRLIEFSRKTPASPRFFKQDEEKNLTNEIGNKQLLFNTENPISPIYEFKMQQLLENADIQDLLTDQSFLAVAQEYLGCRPVLDLVAMWWSIAFDGKATREAAQEYHFDMDRLKFLKFFIYLTDVNTNNGPHCYVKSSHTRKPKSLLSDGRKTDAQILSEYSPTELVEICGQKGAIIIADTRGFHKGKPLIEGYRLMFEIEFANSLFGATYPKVIANDKFSFQFKNYVEKYPYTYSQIIKD